MKTSTWKLLVGPTLLAASVSVLYALSIDTTSFNRADVAFLLMAILASFNAWVASRWFEKGYMTFEAMKMQEEVASKIIGKLIKKYEPDAKKETIIETILAEQIGDVVKDLTKIIEKHKS